MRVNNKDPKKSKFANSEVKRQALLKYSEFVLNGTEPRLIYEMLYDEFNFTLNQSLHFYNEIKDTIAEAVVENNETVVSTHIELYEDVYRRYAAIDDARGMMKAMKQKEELLKLYETESTEVVINKQTNIFLASTYDTEKLETQEQSRLIELLNKATQ